MNPQAPTPPQMPQTPDELPRPITDVDAQIAKEFAAMHPIEQKRGSHFSDILQYASDGFKYHKLITIPVTVGIILITGTVTTLALRSDNNEQVATDSSQTSDQELVFDESSGPDEEVTVEENNEEDLPAIITTPLPGAAPQPTITVTPKPTSKPSSSPVVTPTTPSQPNTPTAPVAKYKEKEAYQETTLTGYRCEHENDDKISDSTDNGCRHNMDQYDNNKTGCENHGGTYNISTGNCRRFHGTVPVYTTKTYYRCPAGTNETSDGKCLYY
jgi:hypothetical protein